MFKKNPRLTFEILPDKKILIETVINNNVDPDEFSKLVNDILLGNNIEYILNSILEAGIKCNNKDVATEICKQITNLQENIEIVQKTHRKRNPAIKPSEVFKIYQNE